jgi:hypothetical protein
MHLEEALLYGHPHEHRRRHPWKTAAKAALWILLGLVVIAIPVSASAWRMFQEAQAGRQALVAAASAAKTLEFPQAATDLRYARAHLAAAERFGSVLAPFAILPYVGSDIRDGRALISASLETATALERVASLGEEVLGALSAAGGFDGNNPTLSGGVEAFFRLPTEGRRAALAALARIPGDFSLSVSEIDQAMQGFEALKHSDSDYVGPIVQALQPVMVQLIEVRDRLAKTAELAKLLPALSGYPEPKTYLLLMQNDTELRPTGGFIGTVGSVMIDAATARDLQVADVYSLDGQGLKTVTAVPPAPLVKYLGVDRWFLRDANWSPDFPIAAQQVIKAYAADGGRTDFDGVIAIDTTLAADMLRIVGDVKIGSSTFTAKNVTEEIEFQVEKGFSAKGIPTAQRKDVLLALVGEVFKRVIALPSDRWGEIVTALSTALDGKHMLVASFDPTAASYLRSRNWDGMVRSDAGDFLMVVDANLAALKTDSVMSRSVGYWIKPDKDSLVATVDLKYRNNGSFTWKTTRYRTYTRIYVPEGSEFVAVAGNMFNDKIVDPKRRPGVVDSGVEFGRRWFGTFISIEPGETRDLYFSYRLPSSIVDAAKSGAYSLTVQKQPGIGAVPLTLSLDFGKRVEHATPPEASQDWGDGAYKISSDLAIDRQFTVRF